MNRMTLTCFVNFIQTLCYFLFSYFDAVALVKLRSNCRYFCRSSMSLLVCPGMCVENVCVAEACLQILVTPCLPLVSGPTSPGHTPSSWLCFQHELAFTLAKSSSTTEALPQCCQKKNCCFFMKKRSNEQIYLNEHKVNMIRSKVHL